MKCRLDALIELLFDDKASITERDEAATNLAEFSETRALNALLSRGNNADENELVLNSCGESIGAIWTKQNIFDEKSYRTLSGIARYGVFVVVKSRKPQWLEQYHLEKDNF
ncbi:MAG: hypothetical protein WCP39_05465 [Chlamydiota bacterium]